LLEFAGKSLADFREFDAETLAALQLALFRTSSRLAVLMCSDLLGLRLRFNLPGSYGEGTWSDRMDLTLHEFRQHPEFGPRIENASKAITDTGRDGGFTT
jgi:4-alpha-glucanotransferase